MQTPRSTTVPGRYNALMRRAVAIGLACLSLAASPPDPHPLDAGQFARLETADDGSATVEEAALYALLENAAEATESQAGAVVPNYNLIRRDPAAWRGTRCLIEGTIALVMHPDLSREGWEKVEGVVVRVDHSREPPVAEDFVIVFVTDPPRWTWWNRDAGLPQEQGTRVRLVGRFYKIAELATRGSADREPDKRSYLTFVARSLGDVQSAAAQPAVTLRNLPLFLLIAVAAAYLFWRLRAFGRRSTNSQVSEYVQRRRQQRAVSNTDTPEAQSDLPDNPLDALDALAEKHASEEPSTSDRGSAPKE